MPRMQVYLPDELYVAVKEYNMPASKLLQDAVRTDLRRRELIEGARGYLAELIDEVGEPSAEELRRCRGPVQRHPPGRYRPVTLLVLDSGGLTALAQRRPSAAALIETFIRDGIWPPVVPSVVLAECVSGRQRTDAAVNRFLKHCEVVEVLPEQVARRAGTLRALAGRGSAVDAVVVAGAEPGGTVLTGDVTDLRALAEHAKDVEVRRP